MEWPEFKAADGVGDCLKEVFCVGCKPWIVAIVATLSCEYFVKSIGELANVGFNGDGSGMRS